jgi:hypothetical protein
MQAAFREGSSPLDMASATQTAYGLYVADSTQRFGFGQRFLTNDGRVFKYAKAGGTLNVDLLAQSVVAQHIAFASAPVAAAAGDTKVSITVAATDGAAAGGLVAKDELQGGYVVIFSDTVVTMLRQIVKNTAVATGGGTSILDLDFPLNAAVATADSYLEAMASPYSSIKASTTGDTARGFIGLPLVEATSGKFCWIQTWGPCWVAPQADVGTGASNIQVVARYDGSIQAHDYTDTTYSDKQQHVGFVLSHANAGTQGAPFIMLQISH